MVLTILIFDKGNRSLHNRQQDWSFFIQIAILIENHWTDLCNGLGAIGLGIAGVLTGIKNFRQLYTTPYGLLMIIASIISIIGVTFHIKKSNNLIILKHQNQQLTNQLEKAIKKIEKTQQGYSELLNYNLITLFNSLNFNNSERISVYKHDEKASVFTLLSRHSKNPKYKKKGRAIYPDDQGCIGRAFSEGKHSISDLPAHTTKKYQEIMHSEYNMSKDIVSKLAMPTRAYAAFAIANMYDIMLGVIVFESIHPDGLDNDKIDEIMSLNEAERIAYLLEKMQEKEPVISMANSEGY